MTQPTQVIITADDFCASPAINRGVYQALEKNCLNTVSALMNMDNSEVDLKTLKERFPEAKVGVHLTVTSGKPLTGGESLLAPDTDHFQEMKEFSFSRINPVELKAEIKAQIERQLDVLGEVDHISCHHGVLAFKEEFFAMYMDLAESLAKAPIRNPILISKTGTKGFLLSGMQLTGILNAIQLLDDNLGDVGALLKQTKPETLIPQIAGKKAPDYFVDTYYRQASRWRLWRIMRKLPRNSLSELVVHLSDQPTSDVTVNGVDSSYFKGRYRELKVLTQYRMLLRSMRLNGVNYGSFDEATPR